MYSLFSMNDLSALIFIYMHADACHEFHIVFSPRTRLESPTTIRDDMFRDLRRAVQISAALRFSHRCKAKSEIMKERLVFLLVRFLVDVWSMCGGCAVDM